MLQSQPDLEKKIGYSFLNKKYLDKALTHRSYSAERRLSYSNERLEFLGDAVITLIVIEYLVEKFKDKDEGYLSRLKSQIVSSKNLYKWAKKIELSKHIKLSFWEDKNGGRDKPQIIANAFEAVLGAIYMDGGLEPVKKIIRKFLDQEKEIKIEDYKSMFQEFCQKKFKLIPSYRVISQQGPEHRKKFSVAVIIKDKIVAKGEGYSKKEAENNAAKQALIVIKEVVI